MDVNRLLLLLLFTFQDLLKILRVSSMFFFFAVRVSSHIMSSYTSADNLRKLNSLPVNNYGGRQCARAAHQYCQRSAVTSFRRCG